MRQIVLIIHNVRSAHNVGSLLRSADGLGVKKVYLSGYTPYPQLPGDTRLPHIAKRMSGQIHKTALGAETNLQLKHIEDINGCLASLGQQNYTIVALEQTSTAVTLEEFRVPDKIALIVGSEVGGISRHILEKADIHIEIPMMGAKESFNVAVAGAIALYQLRYC